jgi:GIY-YIG catalytic domain
MKNNKNNLIATENNNNIVYIDPTVSYENADTQKIEILKANKEKAGIYRWTNKESGKSYVGSAIDLSKRLINYYSLSYLEL